MATASTSVHAGLELLTREQVPRNWAATQANLGNTLRRLGEREKGTAWLEQAVKAYEAALKVLTREQMPRSWAMNVGNQGVAVMLLADRLRDGIKAKVAVQQIEDALRITREGGDYPATAYYEAQLLKARDLANQLAH